VLQRSTMDVAKLHNSDEDEKKEDEVVLPGFRFHPTDEELVGFYLRRKVEKKPLRIELIKQIDIYKYDPWDLPSKFTLLFIYPISYMVFITEVNNCFLHLMQQMNFMSLVTVLHNYSACKVFDNMIL